MLTATSHKAQRASSSHKAQQASSKCLLSRDNTTKKLGWRGCLLVLKMSWWEMRSPSVCGRYFSTLKYNLAWITSHINARTGCYVQKNPFESFRILTKRGRETKPLCLNTDRWFSTREHLAIPEDIFIVTAGWRLLLASSGWAPGMLLKIL